MELITMHTHSTFCGHAYSTLDEMVQAASEAGITALAATEHYPLSPAFKEYSFASMPSARLAEYADAVRSIRKRYPRMQILLGCELDWLGDWEDRGITPESFAEYDIVLGSVHFIDGWLFNSSRCKERWSDVDPDDIWERYVDLWCEAATSPMPYTVMAHPDVIKKFGYYPDRAKLQDMYDRMAQAAASGGRMIEVNTSGKFTPCGEYYPTLDLLKRFHDAGVRCTVGTDAHRAEHIARDIREAYAFMREAGYTEVAVPLVGGGVRMMPIA